jgi:hypothetical protein
LVQGQGWSAATGGISGNGWSLAAGGVGGNGWNHSANGLSTNGWITTNQVVKADGGAVVKAGVWTDGNLQSGGAVFAKGWINTDQVVKAGGQVQCGGALIATGGAVAKAGVWTDGNVQCGGQVIAQGDIFGHAKHFVMPHPNDATKDIVYGSIEGPEAAAYTRGRATLQDGKARVEFPEHFILVINPDTLTIVLTPRSAASKGLAIVESGSTGFAVEELFNGTGSYQFDYFASGVRRGYEGYQPIVTKGSSPVRQGADATIMPVASPASTPASPIHSMPTPEMTERPEPTPGSVPLFGPITKPEPWTLL